MNHPTTAADILASMGAAGLRLDAMDAVESAAGNISISIRDTPTDLDRFFPETGRIDLPVTVPGLAGWTFFVTGSGSRLRDIAAAPAAQVSVLIVEEGGRTAVWRTNPERTFDHPTSEFNSHLGVHEDQVARRGLDFQAVIHAQPRSLVSLSHIKELRNTRDFNHAILRWEPETIVQVPMGIEVLDFMVPGSEELGEANVAGLRSHQLTLWSKHGLMVRSDESPLAAVDKVEYLEAGASYEIRNRQLGGACEGLLDSEIKRVIEAFNIKTDLY